MARTGHETLDSSGHCVILPPNGAPDADAGVDVNSMASQIHVALCLMKIRNVVTVETRSVPATPEEREATLMRFREWTSNHGWRVAMSGSRPLGRNLKIKRRGLSLFGPEASVEQIIARGRWTARAFEALRRDEAREVALYIGKGARHSNWSTSIEW